jgi:hypothetical protein
MEEKSSTSAKKLEELALEYHSYYNGKIDIGLKAPVRSYEFCGGIADRRGRGRHKRCKIHVRCRREMGKYNKGG